jgi:L-alanine-DL-glutamate epimerase-like enolase superfamily enzyme
VKLEIAPQAFSLSRPFETSYGTLAVRETLVVALTDADGVTGYGEAAPLEAYDGVSLERVLSALERCREVLEATPRLPDKRAPQPDPAAPMRELLERCARAARLPQALAAVDLALWDMLARRSGQPLYRLLDGKQQVTPRVAVNATVTALDRAQAAEQAAQAAHAGYPCVKIKVGVGDDAGRVAAVRAAAGPQIALRLDANGAWRVPEAIAAIAALAPAGLELVEEPVHGAAAMREVREQAEVRVAIDETATEPGAIEAGAADAVRLKLSSCGGVTALLGYASRARAAGCEVYVGSAVDGPLGVAGALHAAAAVAAQGPMPPCGLATLRLLVGMDEVFPVEQGSIAVPEAPGLGVPNLDQLGLGLAGR